MKAWVKAHQRGRLGWVYQTELLPLYLIRNQLCSQSNVRAIRSIQVVSKTYSLERNSIITRGKNFPFLFFSYNLFFLLLLSILNVVSLFNCRHPIAFKFKSWTIGNVGCILAIFPSNTYFVMWLLIRYRSIQVYS